MRRRELTLLRQKLPQSMSASMSEENAAQTEDSPPPPPTSPPISSLETRVPLIRGMTRKRVRAFAEHLHNPRNTRGRRNRVTETNSGSNQAPKTVTLPMDEVNTHYSAFYMLSFNLDGRKLIKIGKCSPNATTSTSKGIRERMTDYINSYGFVCPLDPEPKPGWRSSRGSYTHECDPAVPGSGVYLHMLLLYKRHLFENTTRGGRSVAQEIPSLLENTLKRTLRRPLCTGACARGTTTSAGKLSRGSERFRVSARLMVSRVIEALRVVKPQPLLTRRSSMRGSSLQRRHPSVQEPSASQRQHQQRTQTRHVQQQNRGTTSRNDPNQRQRPSRSVTLTRQDTLPYTGAS